MEQPGNRPAFEIENVVEQTPFKEPAVRAFFEIWCSANSFIVPQFLKREEWLEKRQTGILEKRDDQKENLYIPDDLRLWEMVGIMEEVDQKTFSEQPDRRTQKADELRKLGKTFENSGVYLAQRINSIRNGREIAEALAEEFYNYGRSLLAGERSTELVNIADIPQRTLTKEETEEVDRFLAGNELYSSRKARTGGNAVWEEGVRRTTLDQFFGVTKKALELENDTKLQKNNIDLKPWQSDIPNHTAFIEKIKRSLSQKVEAPKQELTASVFRGGMELLRTSMPFDSLPGWTQKAWLHWENGEKSLGEALQIDLLKKELEDVRAGGDMAEIGKKEREIASSIQQVVSRYKYKKGSNRPSEMAVTQEINCVGASMLGGSLMGYVGLKYLVGDVPGHSLMFLVSSDGLVEDRDMLKSLPVTLKDSDIRGKKKDGTPLTVSDIAAFGNNPRSEGLLFEMNNGPVSLFPPEYGQKIQALSNLGSALRGIGRYEESAEVLKQGIALCPKDEYLYYNLGLTLNELGRNEEAVDAYRKAVLISLKDAVVYYGLGYAVYDLGRYEEAVDSYDKAIRFAPKYALSYFGKGKALFKLGRYKESLHEFQEFLQFADADTQGKVIQDARDYVVWLRDEIAKGRHVAK